jgi:hypothetical protein
MLEESQYLTSKYITDPEMKNPTRYYKKTHMKSNGREQTIQT